MTASTTLSLDAALVHRVEALAAARGVDPQELLAELISEAETAELVAEVNSELERLAQPPEVGRRKRSDMRRMDAAMRRWMHE